MNEPLFRILMIDDESEDALIFADVLQEFEHPPHFTHCSSGIQAVHELKNASSFPDLILLDLNMPMMDGREVLDYLKQDESLRHIPVVIFSNTSKLLVQQQMLEKGACRFIHKPADIVALQSIQAELISICKQQAANSKQPDIDMKENRSRKTA